jgi:hypothetical protein
MKGKRKEVREMTLEEKLKSAKALITDESEIVKFEEYEGEVLHGFSTEYEFTTITEIVEDFRLAIQNGL